jgi:chromosome segregation ATPase
LSNLENQVKLHDAKIGELNKKLHQLQEEKNTFARQKNIPMAKRKIQEKHRVLKQISRFSQLKEACQNMQESISDSSVVKQTFTVLSDVSWTFRNVKFDEKFNEQLSKFSEQVDDMKFDLAEMNDALSTVNAQDEKLNEELERELQDLLS